ncbi:MAG: SixA phosphatase family protein [Bacteroidota bacterium]
MISILVQHGKNISKEENPDKPLSVKGREQIQNLVNFLTVIKWYPERIIHSGKLRAAETAEILGKGTGCTRIEVEEYLNPKDEPDRLVNELIKTDDNILVVGHMPFLDEFVKKITMSTENDIIDITHGSPLMIAKKDNRLIVDTYIQNRYLGGG